MSYTYLRARELCQHVGETPQLFVVSRGLWVFSTLRAEYETARDLANQGLSLAQRLQDSTLLLCAHQDLGFFSLWPGEWQSAREHFERAMTFYDPRQHRSYVSLYEADLGVWALSEAAVALWCLGYPDQAWQKIQEALTLVQKLAHPNTSGWALLCTAWLHQYCREPQETQNRTEAAIALAHEHGFPLWLAYGTVFQGWALAMQGQEEEGIIHIHQGMITAQGMGTEMAHSHHLALLAEAYGNIGQSEDGLRALSEALEFVEKTGERVYEAELYRLKGTLTLKQSGVRGPKSEVPNTQHLTPNTHAEAEEVRRVGSAHQNVSEAETVGGALKQSGVRGPKSEVPNPQHPTPSTHAEAEAEACFHKAIEIARHQSAKSLELRAVMSLSRLWQQQGKPQEA
ncbi:MAG: hypothetical protein HY268_14975, partial [Deltaproteobacteria bacterium]|nr:hypothetical protein [Deltaproteobacteria bacterium]